MRNRSCLKIAGAGGKRSMRFVRLGKPDANKPENHQEQGCDAEKENNVGGAQDIGEQVRPSKEQGSRGDEQRETHPPEMTNEALRAEKTTAQEHAEVASG